MVLEGQTELIQALAIAIFSTWPFAKKNNQRLSSVGNILLYMCIRTYTHKRCVSLGLGPLAHSSAVDHHQ